MKYYSRRKNMYLLVVCRINMYVPLCSLIRAFLFTACEDCYLSNVMSQNGF